MTISCEQTMMLLSDLLAGAAQPGIDMLALGYVAARILYGIFYITDRSTLRSLAWVAGLGCIIVLFVTAA